MHSYCLICSSDKLKKLEEYQKYYLCQCAACGFVFTERIPTTEELINHYKGYGRNDYLSPITIKRYHELLDEMEIYKKTGNLLDVGCGIGYFLEEAKKRGWNVYGTEYTDQAISICESKGINMKQGKLNPEDFDGLQFDVICSFEVIEHINNPKEELANFYSLLRKGGLVYITTPNFNSLLRYRLKADYNVICYPEHLSYYTPKTLSLAFKNAGFTPKMIKATGVSITRLKTSKKTSQQAFISETSDDEVLRNKMETNPFLGFAKNTLNALLSITGKGDSLKGYFIK